MKRFFFSLMLALCAFLPTFADSPLTSTEWWQYYENKQIVTDAHEYGYNDDVINCLINEKQTLDLRLAIVNAVGWNFNGQNGYGQIVARLQQKYGKKYAKKLTPETLCVLAYVKAMDDYFNVAEAETMAKKAHKAKPSSRGIGIIYGLIHAQGCLYGDWAELYNSVARFVDDDSLTPDMTDYAIGKIMEYIDLYK